MVSSQYEEDKKHREMVREERVKEFPRDDLTLKICINGPLFTGKSVQAASLKTKYPELLVLEAETILRECLVLTDPLKKEEEAVAAADPKKKKEAPKKG